MVLRSKDSATAQAWFNAIHSSVNDLIPRVIAEVRDQLGKAGIAGSREIRHLGWLAEKVMEMFLFSCLSSLLLYEALDFHLAFLEDPSFLNVPNFMGFFCFVLF